MQKNELHLLKRGWCAIEQINGILTTGKGSWYSFSVKECIMKWNERLRYEREAQGWTQRLLAEKIRTTKFTVIRWENGTAFPNPFYRNELSRVFGKSLEELGLVRSPA